MTALDHPLITLTTDFGSADGFPASIKGVILGINPGAAIVDVTHEAPPQDIAHASFVLGAVAPYFPRGTVHVAVVDPGVGTERAALALRAPDGSLYVGPDNGVFSHVMASGGALEAASHERPFLEPGAAAVPAGWHAHAIENPEYVRSPVSATFHGRDVFAPAAAHLSLGVPVEALGPELDRVMCLNLPGSRRIASGIAGHIQHIDRFGNLATDIPVADSAGEVREVRVRGRRIPGMSGSYRAAGGLGCVAASHGYLEIALYGGSAAETLGAAVGDEVTVEFA